MNDQETCAVVEVRSAWLTVNNLILALKMIRKDYGGQCVVRMVDDAPVKSVTVRKQGPSPDEDEDVVVYVSDQ
jgi:hypothetical protein